MARLRWHRRQRRLPTTYVEVPPGAEPLPLDLDVPAFGPDREFRMPGSDFPSDELVAVLSTPASSVAPTRLPEPPAMSSPPASTNEASSTPPAASNHNRPVDAPQTVPTDAETQSRQRVLLGEWMADVTMTDVDVVLPESASTDR